MQDTDMANACIPSSSTGRSRTKKKSTLAKLKEKKDREMGSSSSLQKNIIENNKNVGSKSGTDHKSGEKPMAYHVSTKDHYIPASPLDSSKSVKKSRPQPKPRTQKSQSSSELVQEGPSSALNEVNDALNVSSDSTTLQRLKNLKMVTDQGETIDTFANAKFIPKPPVTPRSSRNTPRTPRTLVSPGKREKRIREPWSSGDEHEIEEKREKNGHENETHGRVFDVCNYEMANVENRVAKTSASPVKEKLTTDSQIPTKSNVRLLNRRNSKDAAFVSTGESAKIENVNSISSFNLNNSSNTQASNKMPAPFSQNQRKSQDTKNLERSKPPPSPNSSPSHTGATSSSKSDPDLKQMEVEYSSNNSENVPFQSEAKSTQVLFTSTEKCRSISSPRSGRLEPVSPKSHPPPLPKEFTSHSLKTAYKIDPNVRPYTASTAGRSHTHSDSGGVSNEDKMSQRSFQSGSVLPIITTQEARSRSFLEGSISSASPSMLGLEELERYFPERKINVLIGTWNMNELKDVTSSVDDFILPEKCLYVQDIYAIGTQENNMNKKEWEIKLQETLGPSHVLFHSVTLGSLHLVVFIRRDLIWFCSAPESATVSLRAVTMVKTKGAIGISFTLFGSSLLFINCHLTSDRDNDNSRKKSRLGDYFKVVQEMDFKLIKDSKQSKTIQNPDTGKKQADVTSLYDSVFWFGDLNFRIERQRHAVEGKVHQITAEQFPNFETLLGGDQLLKFMMEGRIFHGFQEGRINFHPTFKFDVNTDSYDTSSKNRVPSYTDRIMFRSKKKNDITCLHYDAVMELKISDHRPVFGQFEAGIRPGRDNLIYGAGHFDRSVYVEANQRRAANPPTQKKSSSSSICSIQ